MKLLIVVSYLYSLYSFLYRTTPILVLSCRAERPQGRTSDPKHPVTRTYMAHLTEHAPRTAGYHRGPTTGQSTSGPFLGPHCCGEPFVVVRPHSYKLSRVCGRFRFHSSMDFRPAMSKQIPQELVDEVIDNLNNPRDLRACSLVSSEWLDRSRHRLFANVALNTWNFDQWRTNIPPGPNGISAYVRSLTLRQARSIVSLEPETLMGIMDHLTSFQQLKALLLHDVNFDDAFDAPSLSRCFGHFGVSVKSLHLHGIRTNMSTMLFFISLFPNLNHLTISSPILSSGETEVPKGVLPLRGALRLSGLGATSSALLQGILLIPLHLEEISVTHSQIADSWVLNRLIETCAPTLKKVELTHLTSGTCEVIVLYGDSSTDGCLLDSEGNPVSVSLSPCHALMELTTNTVAIKRPSPWIDTMLSTISVQATQFERVVLGVQRQLSSPDIGDQVHAEAWESVEDILYELALKLNPESRFELVFMANPTYDEEEIELGGFLDRFTEVAAVRFASV